MALVMLLAVGLSLLSAAPASALDATEDPYTVDTTDDGVDDSIGDGSCETAGGDCTLRAAIEESNFDTDLDTIVLPVGTYILTIGGTDEDASATGDLDVNENLIIRGAGAGSTIIDADDLDRAVHVPGTSLSLSGVTVQNGTSTTGAGGIHLSSSSSNLILARSVVQDNEGTTAGGVYAGGTATVTDTTIQDNTGTGEAGGIAIEYQGIVGNSRILDNTNTTSSSSKAGGILTAGSDGPSNIRNTLIEGNTLDGTGSSGAGGLQLYYGGTLTDVTINDNTSSQSGCCGAAGLYNDYPTAADNLEVTNNTHTSPSCCDAGGIYAAYPLNMTNSLVENNTVDEGYAGGIYNDDRLTLDNSVVRGNMDAGCPSSCGSTTAGGIYIDSSALIKNSTIEDNMTGSGTAGAIYAVSNTTLDNVDVLNNFVDGASVGGVYITARGTINNSTIRGNGDSGCPSSCNGTTAGGLYVDGGTSVNNSVIEDNVTGDGYAGGVYADSSTVINGTSVSNNTNSDGGYAGGIYIEGNTNIVDSMVDGNTSGGAGYAAGIYVDDATNIRNTTIRNNTESEDGAGGIYANDYLTLANSTVSGNIGEDYAGGIYVNDETRISRSRILNNRDTGSGSAGGIYANSNTGLVQSTVQGNVVEGDGSGGGLWVNANTTIDQSTIARNQANTDEGGSLSAGGIYGNDDLVISNSTFSGNQAFGESDIGGVYLVTGLSYVQRIHSSTLADNVGPDGGALATGGGVSDALLGNSVLKKGATGDNCAGDLSFVSDGYNLSSDASCATVFDTGAGDVNSTAPNLKPLGSYGGFTQTQPPNPGSPAIDTGSDEGPDVDQRGVTRPQGDGVDKGAVEHRSRPDGHVRRPPLPFLGNNIYNLTAAGQTATATVRLGRAVNYELRIQNDGDSKETIGVQGQGNSSGYTVKYFRNGIDVSTAVKQGTFAFVNLLPGAYGKLVMQVTVGTGVNPGTTLTRKVTATSSLDGDAKDVVATRTKAG